MADKTYDDARVRAALARIDPDELDAAIQGQRGFCVSMLRSRGMLNGSNFEDVLSDVLGEISIALIHSLPRFEDRGEVSLAQWATGVARNVLAQRVRSTARRGDRELELEDSLVGHMVASQGEDESEDAYFLELICMARDRIIARPGGISTWQRLVRMATQPERGREAREQVREELAEVSGLPPSVFGVEATPPAPEPSVEAVGPAVIEAAVRDGVYVVDCSVHGVMTVRDGSDPVTAMLAARAHRDEHDQETKKPDNGERS